MPSQHLAKSPGFFAVPRADVLNEKTFAVLFAVASSQRKARAKRFLKREDACRAIVAEALIRYSIMIEAGFEISESSIIQNDFGKPSIPDSDLHFNVAHSGEWVVCGVDTDEIGVDIEKHHQIGSGIAHRFFSKAEIAILDKIDNEEDRCRMFFQIWSLKESYIKAIGKGLSCPLDSFACIPSAVSGKFDLHLFQDVLSAKYLQVIDLAQNYSCAVCCSHQPTAVCPVIVDADQLVNGLL